MSKQITNPLNNHIFLTQGNPNRNTCLCGKETFTYIAAKRLQKQQLYKSPKQSPKLSRVVSSSTLLKLPWTLKNKEWDGVPKHRRHTVAECDQRERAFGIRNLVREGLDTLHTLFQCTGCQLRESLFCDKTIKRQSVVDEDIANVTFHSPLASGTSSIRSGCHLSPRGLRQSTRGETRFPAN